MTDEREPQAANEAELRDRIEDARSEAAAYVVQRQPMESGGSGGVGAAEERIVDAVDEAQDEEDPGKLEDLAEEAEQGRDDIRRRLFGPGSDTTEDDRSA